MANKSLNFNKVKKSIFTVTLPDEKETVLLITSPTKAIMRTLVNLQSTMNDDEIEDETATDALYEACAVIMSRNKAGHEITADYLGKIFDVEDLYLFINDYTDFISGMTNSKN